MGSAMRTPELLVLADGTALPGAISAHVSSGSNYAAARFQVQLAASMLPVGFIDQSGVTIEIRAGLDGVVTSLVTGAVDMLRLDPVGGLMVLEGRDFTAAFIEARTREAFANHTASEIANILAARHDLSAQITATMTPVGRYYQAEHDRITLDQFARATTEWDLLVFLAQQEGFDVFVQGSTLYFQPPQDASVPVALQPGDCESLRLDRALTLARDIVVSVKSWNSRQKSSFVQTARAGSGTGIQRPGRDPVLNYILVRPNLTPQQALQLAQQVLADLSRHERSFEAVMPGELMLAPRSWIALSGTGSQFDATYQVARLDRQIGAMGFSQRLRASTLPQVAQATPPTPYRGA